MAGAQWLYWHGSGLPTMGWMGDVEIDPFDSSHALFITGQGLWSTDDVTMADTGAATHWTFDDSGLEETVVLDLAKPPDVAPTVATLLSGVGDIGGFKHDDLTVSPPNGMFDNPIFGNTTSLDFAEGAPLIVARVGTNSSSGGQTGAYSTDGGATWTPFVVPTGNGGSGSIAVAADGGTFVWAPKKGTPAWSRDRGAAWTASAGLSAGMLVASDRVNASKFYATGRGGIFVSTDGGKTFVQASTTASGRPRPVFGIEGDLWIPTLGGQLLHSQDSGATFPIVAALSGVTDVGFGKPATPGAYPIVYLAGSVNGAWGIFRSDDATDSPGATWQHLDDPDHQFGYINCLTGDENRVGRVYLGTSGRGIVYGDPQ